MNEQGQERGETEGGGNYRVITEKSQFDVERIISFSVLPTGPATFREPRWSDQSRIRWRLP